jgi:hypothetical protein
MPLLNYKNEGQQLIVSSIGPNDVLLGRGNHIHRDGNARFRTLVLARSIEYWSCNDNFTKDTIAREIVDTVTSLGGRFLRKVKTQQCNDAVGDPTSANPSDKTPPEQWEVADKETILIKVKQTCRDFAASARKKTASSTSDQLQVVAPQDSVRGLARIPSIEDPSRCPFSAPSNFIQSSSPTDMPQSRDVHEFLFQNLRNSQLNHLSSVVQQQMSQRSQEDHSLLSLFAQQRAILLNQVQTSDAESQLWMPPDRHLRAPRLLQDPQHRQRPTQQTDLMVFNNCAVHQSIANRLSQHQANLSTVHQIQSLPRSLLQDGEVFGGLEFQRRQSQPWQQYVNRSFDGPHGVHGVSQYVRSSLDTKVTIAQAVVNRNSSLVTNINELDVAILNGLVPPDLTRLTGPIVAVPAHFISNNKDGDSDTKQQGTE